MAHTPVGRPGSPARRTAEALLAARTAQGRLLALRDRSAWRRSDLREHSASGDQTEGCQARPGGPTSDLGGLSSRIFWQIPAGIPDNGQSSFTRMATGQGTPNVAAPGAPENGVDTDEVAPLDRHLVRQNQPAVQPGTVKSCPPEPLLTTEEAAAYLAVRERMIRRLVAEQRISYSKVGKYVRFRREDLDAYVAAGRRGAVNSQDVRRRSNAQQ